MTKKTKYLLGIAGSVLAAGSLCAASVTNTFDEAVGTWLGDCAKSTEASNYVFSAASTAGFPTGKSYPLSNNYVLTVEGVATNAVVGGGNTPLVDMMVQAARPDDVLELPDEDDGSAQIAVAVDSKGTPGEEMVTKSVVTLNGEEVSSEEIESKVVSEPEPEIVLTGTRKDDQEDSSENAGSAGRAFHVQRNADGKTFRGDLSGEEMGRKVADYALNFVGNPYVWGGESLERGADCSGFTLAVYKHFGIGLPHNANTQRNYGTGYTLATARAGDLICYDGHIGIYIGNNQIVHAMNEANGMTVSTIGYNHKKILGVRRFFD